MTLAMPEVKRRWYRLTPDRLIVGLPAAECQLRLEPNLHVYSGSITALMIGCVPSTIARIVSFAWSKPNV